MTFKGSRRNDERGSGARTIGAGSVGRKRPGDIRVCGLCKATKVEASDYREVGGTARCYLCIAMSEAAALDPKKSSAIGSNEARKEVEFVGIYRSPANKYLHVSYLCPTP